MELAGLFFETGDYKKSIEYFSKLESSKLKNSDAEKYGIAYFRAADNNVLKEKYYPAALEILKKLPDPTREIKDYMILCAEFAAGNEYKNKNYVKAAEIYGFYKELTGSDKFFKEVITCNFNSQRYNKVVEEYNSSVKKNKYEGDYIAQLIGQSYYYLKDYQKAYELLMKYSNNTEYMIILADCVEKINVPDADKKNIFENLMSKTGSSETIKKYVQKNNIAVKLLKNSASDPEVFMKLAAKYLDSEFIARNSDDLKELSAAYILMLIDKNKIDEALKAVSKFSEIIDKTKMNYIKFKCYSMLNNYEEAVKYIEYSDNEESKKRILKNAASFYYAKQDYSKSYKYYSEIQNLYKINMEEEDIYKYANSGIKLGFTEKILNMIPQIKNFEKTGFKELLIEATDYCMSKKMFNEAEQFLTLYPEKYSELIADRKLEIYSITKNYAKQIEIIEKIKINNNEKLLKLAANAYKQLNRNDEYIKTLILILKLQKNSEYSENIADYYFNKNDYKTAIEYYEQVPKTKQIIKNLAYAYYEFGKMDKSLDMYFEYHKLEPKDKEILIKIAEISNKTNNFEKMISTYEKLVSDFGYVINDEEKNRLGISYYKSKTDNDNLKLKNYLKAYGFLKNSNNQEILDGYLLKISEYLADYYIKSGDLEKSIEFAEFHFNKTGSVKFADKILKYYVKTKNSEKILFYVKVLDKSGINPEPGIIKYTAEMNIKNGNFEDADKQLSSLKQEEDVLMMRFECANHLKPADIENIKNIWFSLIEKSFVSKTSLNFCFENKIAVKFLEYLSVNNYPDFEKFFDKLVNSKYMNESEIKTFSMIKADRLIELGKYNESSELLQKFENDDSDSAIELIVKSYHLSDDNEKLLKYVESLMNKRKININGKLKRIIDKSKINLIRKQYETKKYKEALFNIGKLDFKDSEIANIEFFSYFNDSGYTEAAGILEKSDGNLNVNEKQKIICYYKSGNISKAADLYDKLISSSDYESKLDYELLKYKFEIARLTGDTAAEISCLSEILQNSGVEKYYLFKQIEFNFIAGNYIKTIELFKNTKFDIKTIDLAEKSQIFAGIALYNTGNYFDSYKYLGDQKIQKLLDKQSFYTLAYSAYKIGKLQESWKLFTMIETDEYYSGNIKKIKKDIYVKLGELNLAAAEYGKAIENFKNAYEYDKSDTMVLVKLAESYYNSKSFSAASEIFKKLGDVVLSSADLSLQYGWSLYYIGKESEAASYLAAGAVKTADYNELLKIAELSEKYLPPEKIIELYVIARNLFKNYDLNKKLGDLFLKQNDWLNAARQYNIYLSEKPKNREMLEKLIKIYEQLGNKNELLKCMDELLKFDNSDYSKIKSAADLYFDMNDLKKSKEYYEKYVALNKNDSESLIRLSRIFYETGDYLKAAECFENYSKLSGSKISEEDLFKFGSAYFRLAEKTGDYKYYAESFHKFYKIGVSEKTRFFIIQSAKSGIEYYYKTGDFNNVENLAAAHFSITSSTELLSGAYLKIINKMFESGDYASSVSYSKKYIKIHKENPEIFRILAESFEKLNNIDAARYYYYLAFKFEYKQQDACIRLAEFYEKTDPASSAYYYEQYDKYTNSGKPDIYLKISELFYENSDYANAVRYYEKLDKITRPDLIEHIIVSYRKLDKPDKAAEYIIKYFNITSDYQFDKLEYIMLYYFNSQRYKEIIELVNRMNPAAKKSLKNLNYNIAVVFWMNKEYKNAADYFIEYEKTGDKVHYDFAYYLGGIFYDKTEYNSALKYYDMFSKSISPKDKRYYPSLFKKIKINYDLQKYEDCAKISEELENGIDGFDDNSKKELYSIAGNTYFQLKNIEKAENYFNKLSEMNYNLTIPYAAIGLYYYEIKKFEKALKYLALVEDKSDNIKIFNALADIYNKTGDAVSAEKYYLKLYSMHPSEEYAVAAAKFFDANNNSNKAAEFYKIAVKYNPENMEALYFLGNLYFNLKNYQNAAGYLNSLSKIRHSYEKINEKLAKSYFEINEFDKCAELYNKIGNRNQIQNFEYAYSLMKSKKYADSLVQFNNLLLEKQIAPKLKSDILRYAAETYLNSGNKIDGELIQYYDNFIRNIAENKITDKESLDYLDNISVKTGDFYYELKEYSKSYHYYSFVKNFGSQTSNSIEKFAIAAFNIKNYKDSSRLFNGLIINNKLKNSVTPKYYLYSGFCSYYLNNYEQAYSEIYKSGAFNSKNDNPEFNKIFGKLLIYKNEHKKAEPFLEFAVSKLKDSEPLTLLAEAYLKSERKKEALELFSKSLNIDPKQKKLFHVVGDLYFEFNDIAGAAGSYSKMFDSISGRIDSKILLSSMRYASIYFEKGIYRKSYDIMFKLYENGVNDFKLNYNLALSSIYLQNYEFALKLFELCDKFDIKPSSYYYQSGELFAKLGRIPEAIKKLNKAFDMEPENTVFIKTLASVLEKNSNFTDAVKLYEKLYNLDKNNIQVLSKLAGLYYKNNNYKDAYDLYILLLKIDPTSDFAADAAIKLNELKHKIK
ncbi:tetratricopeptide repeat protein [Candidatus Dependentiae bacterium]|nr:tetratricopeptide repeat protein [Candidatus Dependentiae bacterium]